MHLAHLEIEWSVNRIENYPYTFFVNEKGNPKVHTITPQDFEDYFVYRKNNSVKKGISYSPSKNTHYYDRCSLRRLREVITLKNFQSKNHLR